MGSEIVNKDKMPTQTNKRPCEDADADGIESPRKNPMCTIQFKINRQVTMNCGECQRSGLFSVFNLCCRHKIASGGHSDVERHFTTDWSFFICLKYDF